MPSSSHQLLRGVEAISESPKAMLGEGTLNFSIRDSFSNKCANLANFSSLIPAFAPEGNTNFPSGRLMPQIVQSKSVFLPSAVIGIGNRVTSPLDDVVL